MGRVRAHNPKDPTLEAIRREACWAGPPDADLAKLRECLARAEALIGKVS